MKLLYCPECLDMKKLRRLALRRCSCGQAWGYYLDDDLTAEVGGSAITIAIQNDELRLACSRRPEDGRGAPVGARVLPTRYETLRHRGEPDPEIPEDRG